MATALPELEIDPTETLYMAGVALVVTCAVLFLFTRLRPSGAHQE